MKVSPRLRPAQVTSLAVPFTAAHLTVSSPTDAHEQEADSTAAHVLDRGFADLRHADTPRAPATSSRCESSGQPLDPATCSFMEPRFGCDFSSLRIHADEQAAQAAAAVDATAYTIGHDIVFGAGQYAPATSRGRSLLAHELAQVVHPSPGRLSRVPATD